MGEHDDGNEADAAPAVVDTQPTSVPAPADVDSFAGRDVMDHSRCRENVNVDGDGST